jgi:proteic killer suppression protein
MIKSFKCKETELVWNEQFSKKFPHDIQRTALRKLVMINQATSLSDLKIPPANQLEKLHGNRSEQYAIRINKQWRICFLFRNNNAFNVEIIDYH